MPTALFPSVTSALCRLIQTISHWQRPLPPSLWTHGQMECKGIWRPTMKGKAQQPESHGVWQSIKTSVLSTAADYSNENVHSINKLQHKVSALAFDKIVSIPTKSTFIQIARSRVYIINNFLICQAPPSSPWKMLTCVIIVTSFSGETSCKGAKWNTDKKQGNVVKIWTELKWFKIMPCCWTSCYWHWIFGFLH
jgi:hypothetical protein